jgi:hypothetical protein
MAVHGLAHDRPRRWPRRAGSNGLLQLGWPHYWLLAATLGGMLALVALAFFIALVTP